MPNNVFLETNTATSPEHILVGHSAVRLLFFRRDGERCSGWSGKQMEKKHKPKSDNTWRGMNTFACLWSWIKFPSWLTMAVWTGVSTDVSTGVQTSYSDSLTQAWSSSLSKLWLFKQTTLHRMMGSKGHGFEEQGICCQSTGESQLQISAASFPLINFFSFLSVYCFVNQDRVLLP